MPTNLRKRQWYISRFDFLLDNEKLEHEREVSTFVDFVGNVGGVHEIIMMVIMFVFGSFLGFKT